MSEKSLNSVQLIGRVGNEPELRFTPTGKKVVHFNLATNRSWKTAEGEKKEEATWHRCEAWQGLAETIHVYVSKGRRLHVTGFIRNGEYTDAEGVKRYTSTIVVREMILLDRGSEPVNGSEIEETVGEMDFVTEM